MSWQGLRSGPILKVSQYLNGFIERLSAYFILQVDRIFTYIFINLSLIHIPIDQFKYYDVAL